MTGGPLRIANCSGFYGDRLSAAKEMVEGGPIDVLTGDWLAELTMLILAGNRLKGRPGYARTFLTQMEQVLGTCLDRGIKIVSNAGGLDPTGCAEAITGLATRLGLHPKVAHVTGDDLLATGTDLGPMINLDTGEALTATPLTANAYLGGRPIATALEAGADVVVTGRVTDAALVTGPGMWRYGWTPADLDALAGSVVAGHIIECGCQATGGNYAFFEEIPDLPHCGFPIAELHPDGSSVITKHPGTGGQVSVGTVTAQLLYEIASPHYLGPDVTARFDTIRLEQVAEDRVRVSGVRGEPPPGTLKVALNYLGGYRNTMTLVLTGLNIEAKARLAEEAIFTRIPRESFDQVHVDLTPTTPSGMALLRITVMSADQHTAGRTFSSAVVETGLASYPGFYALTPPGDATPYGIYWPTTIPSHAIDPQAWLSTHPIQSPSPHQAEPTAPALAPSTHQAEFSGAETVGRGTANPAPPYGEEPAGTDIRLAPLGTVAGARSGDKGGNANLGVWVRTPEEYAWLTTYLTTGRLKELLPDTAPLIVDRHELPNLLALNFVIHGLLGRGVAASPRLDPQAKGLAEELRGRLVPLPPPVARQAWR
ncbi:acyclic terpene utilization AtuA family protein [Sphaerisporangium aureirubrum]|uniref:Acyclic terpene utilization AtuA family protein n=1 Tax=Sphaerisporangium aureirubrum TaxID=1544736 RepID=A0ABW1NMA5_9ACTN